MTRRHRSPTTAVCPPENDSDDDAASVSGDAEGDSPNSAVAGGSVTLGDTTYELDPTIQCSFYPGGVISIAGNAPSDPSVEITFDAFEADDHLLSVSIDGDAWTSSSIDATVGENTVSGTAAMSGPDEAPASFELSC